jgi:curved DNA-binding protein CbpA
MKTFLNFLIEAAMSTPDALKTLGLSSNYTDDQLKTAYKKMAVANHPDKGGSVAKMQQINVARDVLSNPTANQTSNRNDYEDEDDTYSPYPQTRTITSTLAFSFFREQLNAEVRSKIGEGQIRVPLMSRGSQYKRNNNPVIILIQRQTNMLGTEYDVRGIYEATLNGKGLKLLVKIAHDDSERCVWESIKSVRWLILEIQKLQLLDAMSLTQVAGKLAERLKYYSKNQTKIDSNVK